MLVKKVIAFRLERNFGKFCFYLFFNMSMIQCGSQTFELLKGETYHFIRDSN